MTKLLTTLHPTILNFAVFLANHWFPHNSYENTHSNAV